MYLILFRGSNVFNSFQRHVKLCEIQRRNAFKQTQQNKSWAWKCHYGVLSFELLHLQSQNIICIWDQSSPVLLVWPRVLTTNITFLSSNYLLTRCFDSKRWYVRNLTASWQFLHMAADETHSLFSRLFEQHLISPWCPKLRKKGQRKLCSSGKFCPLLSAFSAVHTVLEKSHWSIK